MRNRLKYRLLCKYLLIIIFTILIGYVIVQIGRIYWYYNSIVIPEMPENVPKQAFWLGGPDGGFWYNVECITDNDAHITVFWWNGDIAHDTIVDCSTIPCPSFEIINHIEWFNGESIRFE